MNRYEDTYWLVPTRLLREYRHGRLHAADVLMMVLLLNLPSPYCRIQDLRYWWGINPARWAVVFGRLQRKGLISVRKTSKKGWVHITILPPWRLPRQIQDQWQQVFPTYLHPTSRIARQYYQRLRWEFDQELKEMAQSERTETSEDVADI